MTIEEGFGTIAKFLANLGLKTSERVWGFQPDTPMFTGWGPTVKPRKLGPQFSVG